MNKRYNDEALRLRFEMLVVAEWQYHGRVGKGELVGQALHAAAMMIGAADSELRSDAEVLALIAFQHRFPPRRMFEVFI